MSNDVNSLDSVYLRSSQNSQPNSNASDMNGRKERRRVFRIARGDPSPAFQPQKSVLNKMPDFVEIAVVFALFLTVLLGRNDNVHSG